MLAVIIFLLLAVISLFIVNAINGIQEKERIRRQSQRKLTVHADSLINTVNALEQMVPNKMIAKVINDEAIKILKEALALEKGPSPHTTHLESSIQQAQLHSDVLAAANASDIKANYQQETDAQITYAQSELKEALNILRQFSFENIITDDEFTIYETDLLWAILMVNVTSCIGQGQRMLAMGDRFVSKSLLQKAHNLLAESSLPDPRRVAMIAEVDEIIEGKREAMSPHLLHQ